MNTIISFVLPTRNNLKYLKWSIDSIRNNLNASHHICVADDASTDGTKSWCEEYSKQDINFKYIVNEGPKRLGHTILYDRIISELVTTDVFIIWHADMYAIPGLDEEISKLIKPGTIVSLTRIEPSLHIAGPEKIQQDFGIESEEFKEKELLEFAESVKSDKITNGVFAPWSMYKSDFQEIGGHDELFYPQSKEDSSIFNRMSLKGYNFVQTWRGLVYHLTCRGSRFSPTLTTPGKNSSEWLEHNERSTRNFLRMWGTMVRHDKFLKPIVPHKYIISFVVKNCNYDLLKILEPHCDRIYIDCEFSKYIQDEQNNTKFDLTNRIFNIYQQILGDIIVEFDGRLLDNYGYHQIINNLSDIITDSGEIGKMELNYFNITINSMNHYEKNLIISHNTGWRRK